MKREDLEIEPVLSALFEYLNGCAEAGYDILHTPMVPSCSMNHSHFKEIEMVHWATLGEEIVVQCGAFAVILHTTFGVNGKSNAEHDRLTENDIDEFIDYMSIGMKNGAYGHVFSSQIQFGLWYKAVTAPREEFRSVEKDSGIVLT